MLDSTVVNFMISISFGYVICPELSGRDAGLFAMIVARNIKSQVRANSVKGGQYELVEIYSPRQLYLSDPHSRQRYASIPRHFFKSVAVTRIFGISDRQGYASKRQLYGSSHICHLASMETTSRAVIGHRPVRNVSMAPKTVAGSSTHGKCPPSSMVTSRPFGSKCAYSFPPP